MKSEQQENIHSAFKKELGYTCATHQYAEMAIRVVERDYQGSIISDLHSFAKDVGLNVSTPAEDYRLRVNKGYIINVCTCLEQFLQNFKELPGSPTHITEERREKEESYLEWTMKVTGLIDNDAIRNDYRICDYYRLVRNCIVHTLSMDATMKGKLNNIVVTGSCSGTEQIGLHCAKHAMTEKQEKDNKGGKC